MSEETTRKFLERLWMLQEQAGLTNTQLARLIGASPSYVAHLKAGHRGKRLGLRYALMAVEQFPELRVFLTADLPTITPDVPADTQDEEV